MYTDTRNARKSHALHSMEMSKMTARIPIGVLLIMALWSPNATTSDEIDGVWYFQVDRVWSHSSTPPFPSMLLAESSYVPASEKHVYKIVISRMADGRFQADFNDPPFKGISKQADALMYVFDLPMGRFIIMHGKNGLEGELTRYGSGVPITKSERGMLKRKVDP